MTWAHWVLIVLPPAWAGFMAWLAYGPVEAGELDDYGDAVGVLEVALEQPVREACALDDREEVEWQRITRGEGTM